MPTVNGKYYKDFNKKRGHFPKEKVFNDEKEAREYMNSINGYACIILSEDRYYVECSTPFVRIDEKLLAEKSQSSAPECISLLRQGEVEALNINL